MSYKKCILLGIGLYFFFSSGGIFPEELMSADNFSKYTWNLKDLGISVKTEYPASWQCVESQGKEEDYRELVYSTQPVPETPHIIIKVSVYPKSRFSSLEDMGNWYAGAVVKFPDAEVVTEEKYSFQDLNGKRYIVKYSVQYPFYHTNTHKFEIKEECIMFEGDNYFCRITYISPTNQFSKYYPAFEYFKDKFSIIH